MSRPRFYERLTDELDGIRRDGLWTHERLIRSPQGGEVEIRTATYDGTKLYVHVPEHETGLREHLEQLIAEDPAQVFHIFLESHGRKATLKQVREEMVPDVLEKTAWSRWWGRAKKALLKDPEIRIGKGSSPLFELRDTAKSIEEEVAERMRACASGIEKCAVAREYLRTLDLTPQLAAAIGEVLDETLAGEEGTTPSRLALLYLKAD
ncbi:MAG: hypothetical protein ACE5GB_05950, partial [Acidimicrobiales bacterium]